MEEAQATNSQVRDELEAQRREFKKACAQRTRELEKWDSSLRKMEREIAKKRKAHPPPPTSLHS